MYPNPHYHGLATHQIGSVNGGSSRSSHRPISVGYPSSSSTSPPMRALTPLLIHMDTFLKNIQASGAGNGYNSMPRTPHLGPTPLPHQIPECRGITINPAIEFTGEIPNLSFDVSQESSSWKMFSSSSSNGQDSLMVPATYPPLPSLAIISPLFPWAIIVHHSRAGWVTVEDVIVTIRSALRLEVRGQGQHLTLFPSSDGRMRTGMERTVLDMLAGRHRFMGLSTSSMGEETFVLHVACFPGGYMS